MFRIVKQESLNSKEEYLLYGEWRSRMSVNVKILVSPNMETEVPVVTSEALPSARLKDGIAIGTRVSVRNPFLAAIAEMGWWWLDRNRYDGRLQMPDMEEPEYENRGCANCQFWKPLRYGSEEMSLQVHFGTWAGPVVRELPKDMYEGNATNITGVCTLWGVSPEVELGILDELNMYYQGANINGALNVGAGWGMEFWMNEKNLRRKELENKCCHTHRYRVKKWFEPIQIGFLPVSNRGIQICAGHNMWDEELDFYPPVVLVGGTEKIWRRVKEGRHVRKRMQVSKKQSEISRGCIVSQEHRNVCPGW